LLQTFHSFPFFSKQPSHSKQPPPPLNRSASSIHVRSVTSNVTAYSNNIIGRVPIENILPTTEVRRRLPVKLEPLNQTKSIDTSNTSLDKIFSDPQAVPEKRSKPIVPNFSNVSEVIASPPKTKLRRSVSNSLLGGPESTHGNVNYMQSDHKTVSDLSQPKSQYRNTNEPEKKPNIYKNNTALRNHISRKNSDSRPLSGLIDTNTVCIIFLELILKINR
jgi:hypothetical protein